MTKPNITAALVVLACTLAATATPALATPNEFSGKTIKATGEAVVFTVSGTSTICSASSGKGGVFDKAQAKIPITFEKCTTTVPEGVKMDAAAITPCDFDFNSTGSVTMEGGCAIEFKILGVACVLTPSTTENSDLTEVEYVDPEAEKTDTTVLLGVGNIVYKVNKTCESAGVKGSKSGELVSFGSIVAEGLKVNNALSFTVAASVPAEERKVAMRSTNEHQYEFIGLGKKVKCLEANFIERVAANETVFAFLALGNTIKYTTCKTNILSPVEETATITTTSGCQYTFVAANNVLEPIQPGAWFSEPFAVCETIIKVMGCTVTIEPPIAALIRLENVAGSPETVRVKFSEAGLDPQAMTQMIYKANAACTGLPERAVLRYVGESKIGAETPKGTTTNVKFG